MPKTRRSSTAPPRLSIIWELPHPHAGPTAALPLSRESGSRDAHEPASGQRPLDVPSGTGNHCPNRAASDRIRRYPRIGGSGPGAPAPPAVSRIRANPARQRSCLTSRRSPVRARHRPSRYQPGGNCCGCGGSPGCIGSRRCRDVGLIAGSFFLVLLVLLQPERALTRPGRLAAARSSPEARVSRT
jgi:hypothetical protein